MAQHACSVESRLGLIIQDLSVMALLFFSLDRDTLIPTRHSMMPEIYTIHEYNTFPSLLVHLLLCIC